MGQHLGCCQKQTTSDLEKLECTEGQEDINLGDIQIPDPESTDSPKGECDLGVKGHAETPDQATAEGSEDEIDFGALGHVEDGGVVSFSELIKIAPDSNAYRCGASIDPTKRKNGYSHEGYFGTMYYAYVQHVRDAEEELLAIKDWEGNVQKRSNYKHNDEGYVYIIWTGKKLNFY